MRAHHNTYQELMVLKRYGDMLKPDLVLLVYVDNDIELETDPLSQVRPMPIPWRDPLGAVGHLLRKTRIYTMVYQLWPVLISPVGPTDAHAAPGWQRSMDSLIEMAAYCRTREIPFVTFHFRMLPDPVSNRLNTEISSIASSEHFQFGDVLPWFEHRDIFGLVNSFLDTHPNAEGHRILADGMARFLLKGSGLQLRNPTSAEMSQVSEPRRLQSIVGAVRRPSAK